MGEVNFKNRGELVFETLKREILDLKLKPGCLISESDICERFGVSRTPVRERPASFAGTGICRDDSLSGNVCDSFESG